jgi:hypothetical protein
LAQHSRRVLGSLLVDAQGSKEATADPVRISPLFVAKNLRKFNLKLDSVRGEGVNQLYVISFAAQPSTHRSTGTYLAGEYQGRLLVQRRDYAVVHYEALWQVDTATMNNTARKKYGQHTLAAQIFAQVFSTGRTTHVVDYAKGENSHYYARRSIGQTVSIGRALGKQSFYYQTLTEQFFKPLPDVGPAPVIDKKQKGDLPPRRPEVPYRPEFWDQYQRPGGALAPAVAR